MNNNESGFRDDFSLAQELMQKAQDTEDTEAVHLLDKAIDILMRQFAEGRLYDEQIITQALIDRALHLSNLTRYDEALADYDRAIEISERLFAEGKLHDENNIVDVYINKAICIGESGDPQGEVDEYSRAIAFIESLPEARQDFVKDSLINLYKNRAITYRDDLEDEERADADFARMRELQGVDEDITTASLQNFEMMTQKYIEMIREQGEDEIADDLESLMNVLDDINE